MSDKATTVTQGKSNKTLKSISSEKGYPIVGFVVLLVIFAASYVALRYTTIAGGSMMMLFGIPIPIISFTGVFSAVCNFCLIFMVLFYKKPGFIVSMIIIGLQFPVLLHGFVVTQNYNGVSGIFMNFFTIAVLIVIYLGINRSDKYQARLREQAITDRLTGLPNRFACSEFIDQLVERGEKFAVVAIDLNNFKSINDTMGQVTGDQVLIEVASRLRKASDSGNSKTNDFVTHQGGDEFSIIIQKFSSDDDIVNTISYYESVLEERLTIDDCDYVVTASFGYAVYPDDATDGDTLYTNADAAMYAAKRLSNAVQVCRFTPDLVDAEKALEMERKIRSAIDNDTLYFNLQPQFDISRKLRGFEALARMKDDDGNVVSPGDFIPVAEKVGLVDKIDAIVFMKASKFMGELIGKTGADITLSVNVSVRHLMKNDFYEEVKNIIDASGVPASQIEIEITESIMIDSMEKALECINKVKALGVKVAIDDFGTGYSSLSYLSSFPADLLKVDKSFIDKMNSSSSSKQYVAAIISIGHIMNFDVISEGVEQPDQLETLRAIGCDFIQGFIWGRPMPPAEAEELVMQSMRR